MLKLNVERVEKLKNDLQKDYDAIVVKAKNSVAGIQGISDELKEKFVNQLVDEYGKDIVVKLEFVKSFFDEIPDVEEIK